MSTKAIEVKSALKDLLSSMGIVEQDKTQVTYGFPGRSPERKWAVVGEIRWESAVWVTNRSRQEQFTVAVVFSVQLQGSDSPSAEAYAARLAFEFEDMLKADPSIGGRCITSGFVPRTMRSWPIDNGGFECLFETEVSATCRP